MCGIIGAIGTNKVSEIILNGLKKLEYRGYDSSGLALYEDKKFNIIKEEGKIIKLEAVLKKKKFTSTMGIGHTRWATHGVPSRENAHPHASSQICVVHNGIIENYQEIKSKLVKNGVRFLSQTDTEVLPHLIEQNVFVTDGSCMTSTSTQNPSLTYMALTARAVDYAVRERRKLNL
jgi:glucosamine--fructose-6-phosphate aminotransferase (isomerizing)